MTQALTSYRRIATVVVGVACAAFVLGFFFFASAATRKPVADGRTADAIVVLTGGPRRIFEAGQLLRQGRAKHLLISGVNHKTSRAALRRIAGLDARLFACCVTVGYRAMNTYGNALETRNWQRNHDFASLIVVTANYHMPRSLAELSLRMPDVTLIPYSVTPKSFEGAPWWLNASSARLLAQEYLKFLPSAAKLTIGRLFGTGNNADGQRQSMHAGARS